jgi:hypothetical protein
VLAALVGIGAIATYAVTRVTAGQTPATGAIASAPATGAAPASSPSAPVPVAEITPPKEFVDITLQGAPRGARVLLDGKLLGEAPGPVSLPIGDAPLQLTVTAPGYETGKVAVIPNAAASASVLMKRRSAGPASSREGIPRDLENPF